MNTIPAPPITRSPKRVLIVVPTLGVGGVEMDIARNVPRIDRDRFELQVYTLYASGELASKLQSAGIRLIQPYSTDNDIQVGVAAAGVLRSDGVRWRELPKRLKWREFPKRLKSRLLTELVKIAPIRRLVEIASTSAFVGRRVLTLARYLHTNEIYIVHCFLPSAYLIGGLAASLLPGRKLIMSRVSLNFYQSRLLYLKIAERRLLHRRVDSVACNTLAIWRDLVGEGVPAKKITLLYNGIDASDYASTDAQKLEARRLLGLQYGQLVLTVVANLFPYKGHIDLITALSDYATRLPANWRLLCAGRDIDGNQATLLRLARELKIADNVTFLGYFEDIPRLLAASDIHVLPSHEEGLPNSILEAMAAGLPVIATRVGGIPELIEHGTGGILVQRKNPQELGDAILALAHDPLGRAAMGAHNARRAKTMFTLEQSVHGYEQLYTRVSR
ncbi:MAG: glycosyltransferase [Xanthobacteraceae bacterium]|nr:glycosyltransferase [Xanthobacteraceae bacterium]